MSKQDNYRQFYVADYVSGRAISDDAEIRSAFSKPGELREIHVIEYQAVKDLEQKLKVAVEALNTVSCCFNCGGCSTKARQALKEIEGEK